MPEAACARRRIVLLAVSGLYSQHGAGSEHAHAEQPCTESGPGVRVIVIGTWDAGVGASYRELRHLRCLIKTVFRCRERAVGLDEVDVAGVTAIREDDAARSLRAQISALGGDHAARDDGHGGRVNDRGFAEGEKADGSDRVPSAGNGFDTREAGIRAIRIGNASRADSTQIRPVRCEQTTFCLSNAIRVDYGGLVQRNEIDRIRCSYCSC